MGSERERKPDPSVSREVVGETPPEELEPRLAEIRRRILAGTYLTEAMLYAALDGAVGDAVRDN